MVEEASDHETGLTCLVAHVYSLALRHLALVFDGLVLKVKFRNFLQHPKNLTIQLLFEVSLFKVLVIKFLAHGREDKEVAQIWTNRWILESLRRVIDEGFKLFIHRGSYFWKFLNAHVEQSQEVKEPSDCHN